MPKRAHRRLKGMPKAITGAKFLAIKGSKKGQWIVTKIKKGKRR